MVYFARAVDGLDVIDIERRAQDVSAELERHGLRMIDPLIFEAQVNNKGSAMSPAQIVDTDLAVLRRCDLVLMDMTIAQRNYIGCISELIYAYLWKIPSIVVVGPQELSRSWLQYHAAEVHTSWSAAVDAIAGRARTLVPRSPLW